MRNRIIQLAGVITAAFAAVMLAASAAGAVTGASVPTREQAGYQFTGAQFRYIAATTYLRSAGQYAPSVSGLGQSLQLWGGGRVYVLGVSDTTSSSPWSPNVAVFSNSTHSLICAASLDNCADQSGGFGITSYPSGHTVTESIYYNQATGSLKFVVKDVTAASSNSYSINVGTGVSFSTARAGTEFGDTPWSAPAFTAPAAKQKLATFTGGVLTSYKGKALGFTGSYAVTSELIMTGAGSVTEADAAGLTTTGFSTYLEP